MEDDKGKEKQELEIMNFSSLRSRWNIKKKLRVQQAAYFERQSSNSMVRGRRLHHRHLREMYEIGLAVLDLNDT